MASLLHGTEDALDMPIESMIGGFERIKASDGGRGGEDRILVFLATLVWKA
jgi:hypothetical protein